MDEDVPLLSPEDLADVQFTSSPVRIHSAKRRINWEEEEDEHVPKYQGREEEEEEEEEADEVLATQIRDLESVD